MVLRVWGAIGKLSLAAATQHSALKSAQTLSKRRVVFRLTTVDSGFFH